MDRAGEIPFSVCAETLGYGLFVPHKVLSSWDFDLLTKP
jgi:hypothetical protein